ncbi:MAG: hypothetical protein Q8O47_09320 [Candidatus Bathyarchaeota archaeon]|nr:hypothetical protein [Candidatus Bathyarchaeota archaeon]
MMTMVDAVLNFTVLWMLKLSVSPGMYVVERVSITVTLSDTVNVAVA